MRILFFHNKYFIYCTEESTQNHIEDFVTETRHFTKILCKQKWVPHFNELNTFLALKRGTHFGIKAIKILKKLSVALLTQAVTIFKMLKHFYCFQDRVIRMANLIFLKLDSHLPKKNFFICFNESRLKIMKNAFYFILKALFVLEIFKFLP